MAEWDIDFGITAIIRPEVRNPNDKLVFPISHFQHSSRILFVGDLNRGQIMAFFNTMAISGKVSLVIDPTYIAVLTRLYDVLNEPDQKVYELELVAKSKRTISVVKSESFPYADKSEVHQPSVVAFMKQTDLKILDVHPFRVNSGDYHTIAYLATFDGS